MCLSCIKDSASFYLHHQSYKIALAILNKRTRFQKTCRNTFMVIEKINFVPLLLIAFDMENKDSINISKGKRKTVLETKLIRN